MARSLVGIHTYGFMPHWRSCFGSYQFGDVDKSTVELLFDPTYQGRRIVVADYATRTSPLDHAIEFLRKVTENGVVAADS